MGRDVTVPGGSGPTGGAPRRRIGGGVAGSLFAALLFASAIPGAVAQDARLFQPDGSPVAVPLPPALPDQRIAELAVDRPADPVADAPVADITGETADDGDTVADAGASADPIASIDPIDPLFEDPFEDPPEEPVELAVRPPAGRSEIPPSPLGTTLSIETELGPDGLPPPLGATIAPEPPPMARVQPPPDETVVSLPGEDGLRLLYASGSDAVDEAVRQALAGLAETIADGGRRIEIRAYASGTPDLAAHARRLSLDRALGVRGYLIDQGVPSARIDVRALGNTAAEGPADRVDVIIR